jgi:hypothetical protein
MPKKCTVCTHPEREAIDVALLEAVTYREIQTRFGGLNKSSLCRHKKHVRAVLVKAEEAKDLTRADSLLEEIGRLRQKAMRIATKAEEMGDLRTALAGVRELTRIVELMAKLRGEIEQKEINILNPEWIKLRAVIINVLEPYPDARLKLAEVLEDAG